MPQPILFTLGGPNLNLNPVGRRGVPPNLCGGRLTAPPVTLTIAGVTKDETGAPDGNYTVYLFDMTSGTPVLSQTIVSDGSGNYSFSVGRGRYWAVDYKSGSPDKGGVTVNTLAGV